MKGLQGLLDEAQSLLSGSQSQAKGAPVVPTEVPPWVVPLGLGAGGLGTAALPEVISPPDSMPGPDLWEPPFTVPGPDVRGPEINVPGPDVRGPEINVPGPDVRGPEINIPGPDVRGPEINTPGPDLPWWLGPLGGTIVKNDPAKTSEGDGQGQGNGEDQGQSGQGDTAQEGQGDSQAGQGQSPEPGQTGEPGLEPGPDVPERIRDILFPGGEPIGTPQKGTPPEIRGVPRPQDLEDVFDQLKEGGTAHIPPTYPGDGYDLPDGGWVGERQGKNGPTIDINIPGVPIEKIHVSGR